MASYEGWLFNEDSSLKAKLQGLYVDTDVNAPNTGRGVPVRYRLPYTELGELTYPHIIIEHMDIIRDPAREHRGWIQLGYAPYGYDGWWGPDDDVMDPSESPYFTEFPIPMVIRYRITVLSRGARELSLIVSKLMQIDRLPPRFGYLHVPQDGTIRTMELLDGPDLVYANDGNDKHLHSSTYVVGVASELLPQEVYEFDTRVSEIHVTASPYTLSSDILFTEAGFEYWRKSKTLATTWNTQ